MPDLRFERDQRKNAGNRRKHGISFEEAETVFYDDRGISMEDLDEEDAVIRVISARKAHREERRECDLRGRK